ncbi:mucin-5AC-like [Acanthopagrus latus]|uniref:mucin-5AC-like n=1 Tax=Acanthopagrus latus TaxID=8177 RepID=UPI00187C1BEF|nr:mucin-5AC-like [Acanthopagrus latus]XP_036967280.1 mucin-5AC-like [Acanthopagrus latus]
MQSTLHCLRVVVVLLSLAPSTQSFSHGASHASCQEMIPGHIRAQPLDPQKSHVTLHTSASSYLPGQLVTVTVRSSRDFMGFLLQARSAEGAEGGAGDRVRARTGFGAGVTSTMLGPVLVGGSWALSPPGIHTLHCLSEGDTLTHSDKQLKRNLSFVWRAPDRPMGDIRFYITVVQSYFVYWAGIESRVVHDGSRSPCCGHNTTEMDGRNSNIVKQEDGVTTLPALRIHGASNKPTNVTVNPTSTPVTPTATSSRIRNLKSLETPIEVTLPVLEMNSSVTLASLGVQRLTNQAVYERNSPSSFGSLESSSKGSESNSYVTSGSLLGVTDEAQESPSSSQPFIALFPSAETRGMVATATPMPNIKVQNSTSSLPLVPFPSLKVGEIESKEAMMKFQDPKLPPTPETKGTTLNPETTTAFFSTNHSFHTTNLPRIYVSNNPRISNQDQTSLVNFENESSSSQPWRTSQTKSKINPIKDEAGRKSMTPSQNQSLNTLLHSQTYLQVQTSPSKTSSSQILPFFQKSSTPFAKSQTLTPNLIVPVKSPTLQSFLPSHTTLSVPQGHPLSHQSIFSRLLNVLSHYQLMSDLPKNQAEDNTSQPKTRQTHPPKIWSQLHSQTSTPQAHIFGWKQTSVVPRSINPLPFTSRFDPTLMIENAKETKDLKAQAEVKTMSPIFASVSSTSPSPSVSSLPTSPLVRPSSFMPNPRTGSSTLVYTKTSFDHATSSSLSSSSSMTKHPNTAPALSALPSPSPISIPPRFFSIQTSSLSPVPSSVTSSTKPSLHISHNPSSTSSASSLTTSQLITSSTSPIPSSATISPSLSSSIASLASSISLSSISTSTSSSSSPGPLSSPNSSATSSPLLSSQSTSYHPEPSRAPHRSLYLALTSTSQQLTQGQMLLIQNRIASSDPEPSDYFPTPRTVVHPHPEPHPNLDPNFKLNLGHELKPNLPKTNTKPKHPSNPSGTPDKEGKYPDIIPRHSALELGMLLGCSAGLGMLLVVGIRYMYRQTCGKRTEVTLNDREREYGRGERGLIHVQECGDLVRVRRIRNNSFVLLAEYDILTPPGD